MPAIRVSRGNVVITIEIEASVDPPDASFYDAETNSWEEPHPNFAKRFHALEQVSDCDWAWCDVTVTARFSDLTGTAYLAQCSYKDEPAPCRRTEARKTAPRPRLMKLFKLLSLLLSGRAE